MYDQILIMLHEEAEEGYQKFASKLLPDVDNIVGVRIPTLRKIAKSIAKGDWRSFLDVARYDTFEETLLQGFVIAYAKMELKERLTRIAQFVPYINNWSICDSFCSSLKFTLQNKKEVWDFLQYYLTCDEPFHLRFGIVMLLNYYIEEESCSLICSILDSIQHDNYYVKMAVAWAVSVCFTKYPYKTLKYLENCNLDAFTYKKTIQKIRDSYKVNTELKKLLTKSTKKL